MPTLIEGISTAIVPVVIALASVLILISKKRLFDDFLDGAKDGMRTSANLFPTLCLLFCAVSMLSSCGITETLGKWLSALGLPDGIGPFLLTRPISGSASVAMLSDLFRTHGPDSPASLAASVIMASSDTAVYVISVYSASGGIRKSRGMLPIALLVMLVSICAAFFFTSLLLG